MINAVVLMGSQIFSYLAMEFNRLGNRCRAPRGRVD
jgi:hypothetical protein